MQTLPSGSTRNCRYRNDRCSDPPSKRSRASPSQRSLFRQNVNACGFNNTGQGRDIFTELTEVGEGFRRPMVLEKLVPYRIPVGDPPKNGVWDLRYLVEKQPDSGVAAYFLRPRLPRCPRHSGCAPLSSP